jgi:hypothetical protein
MQTWIIISGDLRADPGATPPYRYTLTDPQVPDARLLVTSEAELQVGPTTVSGTLVGGAVRGQPGFGWIGQLRADAVLAREPDPPWIAITLAAAALLLALGSRSFYPTFFRQVPRLVRPRTTTLPVGVRREWPPSSGPVERGKIVLEPGAPVELRTPTETQQLRLHSVHSSFEVGELRRLRDSQPVLVVRPASGDLTIYFASVDDRDAAFGALMADTQSRSAVRIG